MLRLSTNAVSPWADVLRAAELSSGSSAEEAPEEDTLAAVGTPAGGNNPAVGALVGGTHPAEGSPGGIPAVPASSAPTQMLCHRSYLETDPT